MPTVGIDYFYVGTSRSHSIFIDTPQVLNPEIIYPFVLTYSISEPDNFECLTSRSVDWVGEGCSISQESAHEIRVNLWHTKLVKVEGQGVTELGYHAAVIGLVMLVACVALTTGLCISDKNMRNYMQAPNFREVQMSDTPSSARSEENKESQEAESLEFNRRKEDQAENKDNSEGSRRVTMQLEPADTATLLFHPSMNLYRQQPGNRRAASLLHLFAVLFSEFCVLGVGLSPRVHFAFDHHEIFLGITLAQIFISISGLVLVQALSFVLMVLNQVGDLGITKKYLGMCISIVLIVTCYGASVILALASPYAYTKFWALCFLACVPLELLVFQNIWWLVNYLLFHNQGLVSIISNSTFFKSPTSGPDS